MKTFEELEKQYTNIPQSIKSIRRWVCFKIEIRDGKKTKVPFNAINGEYGSSTDPNTWTSFRVALLGSIKHNLDGIGFCLGYSKEDNAYYSGVDLDNHNEPDFEEVSKDFIDTLNSYTEYSPSGKGIHIICKGRKPEGRCRKNNIEMYGTGRFFTITGNTIKALPIEEREEELKLLWEKYLKEEEVEKPAVVDNGNNLVFGRNVRSSIIEDSSRMSDEELLDYIYNSGSGGDFFDLYNGNMSKYNDDHSRADAAFCQLLAFWCARDKQQMDRIFRNSKLMRKKWDEYRGEKTYGEMTIDKAVKNQIDVFTPRPKTTTVVTVEKKEEKKIEKKVNIIQSQSETVEIDEKNDPVIDTKKIIFKHYPLNDTGNAERFYDYFGEFFKYNEDDKRFMFWNGKTWVRNMGSFVRKYANKLIDILNQEIVYTEQKYEEALRRGEDETAAELKEILKAQRDNVKKVSNYTGKNAMISELQCLHDIPVKNSFFDKQENLLNTDSGVVNIWTGEVYPFDRKYMLSKNTNCGVSFDEPTTWIKFLHDIFKRENPAETEELIKVFQLYLGDSISGRTNKDRLYITYGSGSNGKSTTMRVVLDCIGEYGTSMSSELLISKQNNSVQGKEFSMDALKGARIVITSETAEGQVLDEVVFKQMLSGETIRAQKKYGDSYDFLPTFSLWMSTNNKPIIRATDDGTWRRLLLIPFLNKFKGAQKDVTMPAKLMAERAQILGWIIQGAVSLHKDYNDDPPVPAFLNDALSDYKKELDVVMAFLNDMTIPYPEMEVNTQELYREYKAWCRENGEFQYNERKFRVEVPKKGYPVRRDRNKGEVYVGLKLVKDERGMIFGGDDD